MRHFFYIPLLSTCLFFFLSSCGTGNEKETQNVSDSASVVAMPHDPREEMEMKEMQEHQQPKENPYEKAKIDIRVFNNDTIKQEPKLTGYGYDILIYDAVYNHQPHIPAINGMRGFHTKEQAQKAAELVVYKIRNNIMPPSVSPQELDSIGVLK